MRVLWLSYFFVSALGAQVSDQMLTRFRGSYDVGEGIGYHDGFTSLEMFCGYHRVENFIGFLDAIGHVFDNGKIAANLGVGARFNVPSLSTMFGINSFYDYRRTNSFYYDQVGAGLEVLSKYFDIRANGYLPFGKKSNFIRNKFLNFVGNDIAFDEITEEVLRGVDGELGFNLVNLGPFRFYAAGGAYFYQRKDCITHLGGQGRLQLAAWQRFFAQVSVTGDSLYNTRVQGQFALDIPLYSIKERKTLDFPQLKRNLYTSVNSYMAQPVIRHPIIPVCEQKKQRLLSEVAVNPITGGPYFFVHVKNTAAPNGNGSISRPYDSLSDAEANEGPGTIIMFNPGDGTILNNASGLTLQVGQKLWGTGVEHFIHFNDRVDLITIPAITPGNNPKMTNFGGDGITLARDTDVSGIDISSPSGRGIFGSNVTRFDVNRNNISASGSIGIELNYSGTSSGNGLIIDNIVTGSAGNSSIEVMTSNSSSATPTIFRNTVSGSIEGITCLAMDTSTLNLVVNANNVSDFTFIGIFVQVEDGATINGNVNANRVMGTYAQSALSCGAFTNDPAVMNINIMDNVVTSKDMVNFGIGVESDLGTVTAVIKNNQVNGSFMIASMSGIGEGGALAVDFENNIVDNGIFLIANRVPGNTCVRLQSNQASSFLIDAVATTLQVESSTFDTSNPSQGLEQANQGPFTFTGTIDFVAPNTCNVD